MMVGLLLASLLCGTAGIQAVIFFRAKRSDPLQHKISVAFLWVLDILQLCFVFNATYFYVVSEIGIPSPPFIWSFKIQLFMQTLIMTSTKLMYTLRLWKLKIYTSKWLPIGVMCFLAADCALSTVFAYNVVTVPLLHDLLHVHFKPLAILSMSTTTATDFVVGFALIYTITKSNTNLSWTNSNCKMCMAYLVNTGMISGVFSAAALIALIIGVQNYVFIFSEIALPQFYVNCFFSMMNASIYFETSRNSNSTVMHILPYFNDESGSAEPSLACDATSSSSRSGAVRTIIMPADLPPKPTINEVGFPLFPLEPKPEPPVVPSVEVKVSVQTSQTALSSEKRRGKAAHRH